MLYLWVEPTNPADAALQSTRALSGAHTASEACIAASIVVRQYMTDRPCSSCMQAAC